MGSAYRRPAALPACLRPCGPCFVHDCVPLAARAAWLTGVPQGPVSIPRPGGRGGATAITPARGDAAQEVAMLVDGGTRCHDSLLRHAARAIVASRPLREARDRQLRQTVPAVVRDRPRITCTSAPLSHYPIGRIRKETGGERPRTGPPRGRHRVAVYSNSASDSTSRTRSTCPAIDCLR